MRFTWFDKLLLVITILVLFALSGILVALALGILPAEAFHFAITVLTNGLFINKLILCLVGIALFAIALRMFVAMVSRAKSQTDNKPSAALIGSTDTGVSYVSLPAIDAMVLRHCRTNNEIKELESNIVAAENGIYVALKVAFLPETVLTTATAELQVSVKEYIETYCGIKVNGVDILVMAQPAAHKQPRVV